MIEGYILTGGKNRRMNGEKKIFLKFRGKYFYEHLCEAFGRFEIVSLSVDQKEPYETAGLPLVVDQYPDFGPLGGLYSGLCNCKEEALFVAACDMPLVNQELVAKAVEAYEKNRDSIVIFQSGGQIHPLFGIYPKSILPLLEKMIRQNNHKVMDLFHEIKPILLECNAERTLSNINTPEEYRRMTEKELYD